MLDSATSLSDVAVRLFEAGRYQAAWDVLTGYRRSGGEMTVRDLILYAVCSHRLGLADLARFCCGRLTELAGEDDLSLEVRGLILQVTRDSSRPVGPRLTNLVGLRAAAGRAS